MYLPHLLLLDVRYVKKYYKKIWHFSEFDTKQWILRDVYYQLLLFTVSQNLSSGKLKKLFFV